MQGLIKGGQNVFLGFYVQLRQSKFVFLEYNILLQSCAAQSSRTPRPPFLSQAHGRSFLPQNHHDMRGVARRWGATLDTGKAACGPDASIHTSQVPKTMGLESEHKPGSKINWIEGNGKSNSRAGSWGQKPGKDSETGSQLKAC